MRGATLGLFALGGYASGLAGGHGVAGLIVGLGAGAVAGMILRSAARAEARAAAEGAPLVLDAGALMDGRIADAAGTGFLGRVFIVPGFVRAELEAAADSPEAARRARGERGIGVMERLSRMEGARLTVTEDDGAGADRVARIAALCREHGGRAVTSDQSVADAIERLGSVALNVNGLADAMKAPVTPGQAMRVFVLKQGRERGQGVAYLEDGTMVVVEGGSTRIGQNVDVVVDRAIQTPAGRMVFAREAR